MKIILGGAAATASSLLYLFVRFWLSYAVADGLLSFLVIIEEN